MSPPKHTKTIRKIAQNAGNFRLSDDNGILNLKRLYRNFAIERHDKSIVTDKNLDVRIKARDVSIKASAEKSVNISTK